MSIPQERDEILRKRREVTDAESRKHAASQERAQRFRAALVEWWERRQPTKPVQHWSVLAADRGTVQHYMADDSGVIWALVPATHRLGLESAPLRPRLEACGNPALHEEADQWARKEATRRALDA